MIECIPRMRDFGIYRDFAGGDQTDVPPFKKHNIVYGWNYSGKTTLSRLFQVLQFPDRPLPYAGSQLTVKFAGGTESNEGSRVSPHPIRVFNQEFIGANFQHGHTAPAVFIVGEESLALRARLDALRLAIERLKQRVEARQGEIAKIERQVSAAGSEQAGAVRLVLGVNDFRRPDLEGRVAEVRGDPKSHILSEEVLKTTVATFRSGDQFKAVLELDLASLPDLESHVNAVRGLLGRTASFDAIEGLAGNPQLQDWLRIGLGLHDENAGECQFCGGELSEERLNALQRHFSDAARELLKAVDTELLSLRELRFEAPRLNPMQLLQEVRAEVGAHLDGLVQWLEWAASIRDSLVKSLEEKRAALEQALEWNVSVELIGDGYPRINGINQGIKIHNESVANMGAVKSRARTAVERHFAAVFFIEQRIAEKEQQVARLKRQIRYAQRGIRRLNEAAARIAQQIDRTTLGKERFMNLVAFLLRGSDIHVESRAEQEFQLMRGERPAEKLSEGEKTAIAFAYFVTSLEADGEDITNTIVYVDDPISSLDSNHVYAVYALITERLETAHQLFVSTHNSEFFSLIKGRWHNPRSGFMRDAEGFYVRRQSDENGAFATLEKLPDLLRKYNSEYEFLFAQIHAFGEAANPSDHEAYTTPNLLRRFLEAYLGFRKPCTSAWHKKLDLILDSPDECREVHKLLDDASHLQSMTRAMQEPAFVVSSQECVRKVLRGLESRDISHYQSLVTVVTGKP